MTKIKEPIDEHLALVNRSPAIVADKMNSLAAALIERHSGKIEDAERDLEETIGQTMALADLLGRRRLLMEADAAKRNRTFRARGENFERLIFNDDVGRVRFEATPIFPRIEFQEAFEDIIGREPRLAKNAEEIRNVYATGGFAVQKLPKRLSRQAKLKLTERIQAKVASFIEKGTPVSKASKILAEMGDFTRSYAETVYRNNLATAYTAGRFRQAADVDVREVMGAFEFNATGDSDTRPNHQAAHGLVAPFDHPVWDRFSPPIGHQCRCIPRMVDNFELEDRGLIVRGKVRPFFPSTFGKAHPDPGFKVERSDRRIY